MKRTIDRLSVQSSVTTEQHISRNNLNIKEEIIDSHIYWKISLSNKNNYIKILKPEDSSKEDIILQISPIILNDPVLIGSTIRLLDDSIKLTTSNGKVVTISKYNSALEFGQELINKLLLQDMDDNTVCPISLDDIKYMEANNIKIYKIKGEHHPYKLEDLQKILLTTGISPITRNKFTESDIIEWKRETIFDIPIGILNAPSVDNINIEKCNITVKPIHVICLIDISCSMQFELDNNVATKPLFEYIKKLPPESTVSLYTFNNIITECFKFKLKEDITLNGISEYLIPQNTTAFFESLLHVLNNWNDNIDESKKNLLLIVTDGEDTCDINNEFKNKLSDKTKTIWNDINCYFMHPPFINGSELLNLSEDQCLAFDNDEEHTQAAIVGLSQNTELFSSPNCTKTPKIPKLLRSQSSTVKYINSAPI